MFSFVKMSTEKPKTKNNFSNRLAKANDGLCKLLLIIVLVFILAAVLLLFAMWVTTSNRLDYFEFRVTMTEKRVRPPVATEDLIDPAPFLFGEFNIDRTQLEVRWKLYEALGSGLPHKPASLDIRGPLRQKDVRIDVAPVVLGLGLGKDSHGRYAGRLDIEGGLAVDILKHSYLYYISISDSHGREIARDRLDKVSTSLL